MAALPLRVGYDCAVIGEGWAARLIAGAMSRAGLKAVLVASELRPVDSWLHPRLRQDAAQDLPRLLPLRGVIVRDAAGECMQVAKPNTPAPEVREALFSSTVIYQRNARFVVQVTGPAQSTWAVGGIYRQVTMSPGEEAFAHLFQTQLPGVVAWLVACGNGLFSLGVVRECSSQDSDVAPAELLEEALVACPRLTGRLVRAQLVGGLHATLHSARVDHCPPHPEAILLPAYDALIDPLFASGYQLAQRCAAELADLLLACRQSPADLTERIAAWQRDRRVQERALPGLSAWYDAAPPPLDKRPTLRLPVGSSLSG